MITGSIRSETFVHLNPLLQSPGENSPLFKLYFVVNIDKFWKAFSGSTADDLEIGTTQIVN